VGVLLSSVAILAPADFDVKALAGTKSKNKDVKRIVCRDYSEIRSKWSNTTLNKSETTKKRMA
jgi:hypothetical protein